jgi:hypothetical protein
MDGTGVLVALVLRYRSIPIDPPAPSGFKEPNIEWFPALQVRIWRKHGKPSRRFIAIADTGSAFCLFQADMGRAIGLDIKKGEKCPVSGVVKGAELTAYFHTICMSIEDTWTVDVMAGFLDDFNVGALLGRRGFFDTFSARFDHTNHPPTLEIDKILRLN